MERKLRSVEALSLETLMETDVRETNSEPRHETGNRGH